MTPLLTTAVALLPGTIAATAALATVPTILFAPKSAARVGMLLESLSAWSVNPGAVRVMFVASD